MTELFFLIIIVLYFLPIAIADHRKHKNFGAIATTNIILGWTGLGWAISLIWAMTDYTKK